MSLFFLMCSERSGSNLITKILNAHSNICGPSTKHVVNPVARNLYRYEPINTPQNWRALLHDINELLKVDFSIWESSFSVKKLGEIAPVGNIRTLIENIFYEEANKHHKQNVFVKENHVYEFFPFLLWYFPEMKYVYQVRDPRDMALSWKKSLPHSGGVIQGARQWKKDQQQSLKNYNELRKREKAILIKYEDLISSPQRQIEKVVQFLEVPFEPRMLQFHQDDLTRQNAKKMKAWENLSKGLIPDNKNKFMDELSEKEIRYIEKICQSEMHYFGYKVQNNKSELDQIQEKELSEFDNREKELYVCERSNGILANMDAKKKMYNKIMKETPWLTSYDYNY